MYSQQGGRPGTGAPKMANRYIKGRLPEGVDFAAYPGRSSTPLPTAESKSAERINQLKIWNEAATNDEKRRLNAAKGMGSSAPNPSARRTDSFKDAKDRHSASFHGAPPPQSHHSPDPAVDPDHVVADSLAHPPSYHRTAVESVGGPRQRNNDMFADRSDSESDEDPDETTGSFHPGDAVNIDPSDRVAAAQPLKEVDDSKRVAPVPPSKSAVSPIIPTPARSPPLPNTNNNINNKSQPSAPNNTRTEHKDSKACCIIM